MYLILDGGGGRESFVHGDLKQHLYFGENNVMDDIFLATPPTSFSEHSFDRKCLQGILLLNPF